MEVTARIAARSASSRSAYLERIRAAAAEGPARGDLGCANLAHGLAACGADEKLHLQAAERRNVAIVSAYNDMLSAHQPFERYPAILKKAVLQAGGVAQFAGGVPAMCDGITQGRAGMELSLFSRDVVAMATAIALCHDMFDGALMLGVCDKIVPGLLIGALSFGHLPTVFVPAGPDALGPAQRREEPHPPALRRGQDRPRRAARGRARRPTTRPAPAPSTAPRTPTSSWSRRWACTCPGASFVNPGTPLRRALTARPRRVAHPGLRADRRDRRRARAGQRRRRAAGHRRLDQPHDAPRGGRRRGRAARSPGTTSPTSAPSSPLLARVYPNGPADINHFHAAGGVAVPDRRAARRRPHAPGRRHRRGLRPRPLPRRAVPRRARRAALAPRAARKRATSSVLRGVARRLRPRRRHPRARRRARPRGDEGLRGRARAPRRHRARARLRRPGRLPRRLRPRRARPRPRRRRSATRARAPTGCPSCTSSPRRSAS